jgi:hypothetical protein
MLLASTVAISCSAYTGIGHLTVYRANVEAERYWSNEVALREARGEGERVLDGRRKAAQLARMNRESLSYFLPTLIVAVLGIIAGGLGAVLRAFGRASRALQTHAMEVFARACFTIAVVCFSGLVLGCMAFLGALLLAISQSE